jgi:hypothetical protein
VTRALALFVLSAALLAGCKQGNGERCQVDNDCSGGLQCNQAQLVCQTPGDHLSLDVLPVPEVDAPTPPPIDAPTPPPIDAP